MSGVLSNLTRTEPGRDTRVSVVTSAAEMLTLREMWDELARPQTLFQSFLWSHAAASIFAEREAPHIVVSRGSGMTIIPAVLRGREDLGLLGETLFDYRSVLSSGDAAVENAAWMRLAELRSPLGVTAVRAGENIGSWRGMRLLRYASAPAIARSDISADELRTRHRRLGRFARRLARKGIMLRQHSGKNGKLVRVIYEAKARQSAATPNLFVDPLRRQFMQHICAIEPGCEVFTYESDVALVAGLVTFRHGTTRHFYTIYFDPKYAADSPGQVLLFEVAALTLQEGLDCDFMTGSCLYKDRLATRQVPLYRVECSAAEMLARGSALRAA